MVEQEVNCVRIPRSECSQISPLPVPTSVAQTNSSHKVTSLGYRVDVEEFPNEDCREFEQIHSLSF